MGHLKLVLLLPSIICIGLSQNTDSLATVQFLRREVEQLCRFDGRGFARKGYQKAARYLRRRFEKMGYAVQMDTFRHSVRYVEKAHIRPAGGPTWQVGIDFWAHPGSPSVKGTYEVDTMPRPGKLWLLPESLSLRAAAQEALARGVIGLLRPVRKVTATYGDSPLPLVLIETVRQVEAGARLHVSIQIRRAEVENYNIIARKAGRQDSFWLLGAHYDHLGQVGRTVFWGANDNASGVAFLLLLAKRIQRDTLPAGVVFVGFGGEEAGLLGAYYFVGRHAAELRYLKGMLNFDLVGFGEKGIAVVGAADQADFWARAVRHRPEDLAEVPYLLRPNAPNSDHYPFREKGYPALFFYLQGGPGYYHDPLDRPETLSWQGAYSLLRWVEGILREE